MHPALSWLWESWPSVTVCYRPCLRMWAAWDPGIAAGVPSVATSCSSGNILTMRPERSVCLYYSSKLLCFQVHSQIKFMYWGLSKWDKCSSTFKLSIFSPSLRFFASVSNTLPSSFPICECLWEQLQFTLHFTDIILCATLSSHLFILLSSSCTDMSNSSWPVLTSVSSSKVSVMCGFLLFVFLWGVTLTSLKKEAVCEAWKNAVPCSYFRLAPTTHTVHVPPDNKQHGSQKSVATSKKFVLCPFEHRLTLSKQTYWCVPWH